VNHLWVDSLRRFVSHAVFGLPPWLVAGAAVFAVATTLVAALFLVAERRYPSPRQRAVRSVSGARRRRQEIREYLDAIGERYAEGHPVAGEAVDFYLPERDVAITFDAQAFFRIQHTDTHPVLFEHEMPGHHLGARLPFEVPEVSLGPDPDERTREIEATIRAAFRSLGLSRGATDAEVKRAYRERVKEVHPDHGGDEEEFRRLREAYVTAREHAES